MKLDWVPGPAQTPRPEEKLSVNDPNARYYPGSNLGKARKHFGRFNQGAKECGKYQAGVKLKEFQDPNRLEPSFPTTSRKAEPKGKHPKKL